jgi:hypothetical protein
LSAEGRARREKLAQPSLLTFAEAMLLAGQHPYVVACVEGIGS